MLWIEQEPQTMNNRPAPARDNSGQPPTPTLDELLAMMDRSDRAIANGDVVPVSEVLADLDAAIVRLTAKRGQTAA